MRNKSKTQKQNNISEQKGFFEMLQPIDSQRYLRQMTLSGFGEAGQAALQAARVLLIGVGGLGPLSGCCRCRNNWADGRRYGQPVEPAPADSLYRF